MKRGQGSLEYLIIIAAVLAIAAIVVLFLTGAFSGASSTGDLSLCKDTASKCATELATSASVMCSVTMCESSCNAAGINVTFSGTCPSTYDEGVNTNIPITNATTMCRLGRPDCIIAV